MNLKASFLTLSVAMALPSFTASSAPLSLSSQQPSVQDIQQSNSWLEIDLGQFKQNIEQFKSHINTGTKICAVMKADAYGNGIRGLMPTILAQEIPCIAITSNGEARAVRESGFKGQLLRVRSASLDEIAQSIELDIEELIGSQVQAVQLAQLSQQKGKILKVHLALNDGGMGRNGIDMSTEAGKQEAVEIATQDGIKIVGIMTHFPNYNADEIRSKLASFNTHSAWLIEQAKLKRSELILHVANSYTALNVPEAQLDMVRPGGVFYGDLPTNPEYPSIVSFKTRIASLHHLPQGSTVGYDSTYRVTRDSVLANLPVGYSDGYPRKMGNRSDVLVNGQRAPVIGVTSMNTTLVDVTNIKGILPNQDVTLFGKQKQERITVTEMEENAELIFPELYTIWGTANPRFYVK
ncbi:alanine racemase [Vibrio aestuarianus]|uniref:Broad specificity amino-acid racemase n=1 Tax=Vibrio aestuarianus TaxID=28171 RepID=A0A9X4IXA3_9VIBR|nr:alanine racemase [Vibrio aestuarianus]MDE1235871.1 alanine racemase [Vibrio aestuarianus]MDE1246759.1 alanine racemase [Vibrio aestuarianus]MDE1347009.1 alanine racemase [Vibrio aestuarianus]NGZ63717.1 alanine racemase [Vibrio aestuarianus subsp. cardii]NGZ66840.1 alanine racemase [Vibrio aestuarianus subsp. cardii]